MNVRDIMVVAVGDVVGADEADSLADTARVLNHAEIGAVIVFGPHGASGILTERDLVRAVAEGVDLDETQVIDAMTPGGPLSIDEEAAVGEAAAAMSENQVRHLLVTSRGRIAGIVSARDILGALAQPSREGSAGP